MMVLNSSKEMVLNVSHGVKQKEELGKRRGLIGCAEKKKNSKILKTK